MTTYKGNVGNLMQHWTLCELLTIARLHSSTLSFIDAHAMAPLASERRDRSDGAFSRVQEGLPGQKSVYEQAWHSLAEERGGYPNSAAFVSKVWKGEYSLLLCEKNPATAAKIEQWLPRVRSAANCTNAKLVEGDWRKRFADGLPNTPLTLISFDPYMYNRREPQQQEFGKMYPSDIERVLRATSRLHGGVLMQLSTYSANGDNPQGAVISSVNSLLMIGGFALSALVWANGNMMSLVYTRGIDWSAELASLPDRFSQWRPARR